MGRFPENSKIVEFFEKRTIEPKIMDMEWNGNSHKEISENFDIPYKVVLIARNPRFHSLSGNFQNLKLEFFIKLSKGLYLNLNLITKLDLNKVHYSNDII